MVPSIAYAEREIALLRKLGDQFLVWGQTEYPPLLALLDDAPPVIAVLGDAAILPDRAVALVGSRNASTNGQRRGKPCGGAGFGWHRGSLRHASRRIWRGSS